MIAQLVPVNASLIMTDVYAVYFIFVWIRGIPIQRLPSESKWTDKKVVEEAGIKDDNQ